MNKDQAFAIVSVALLFCGMAVIAAAHLGLLVGVFLSVLSLFVRGLRSAVPYVLLIPLCTVAGIWSTFYGGFAAAGSHFEIEQLIRGGFFGMGAALTAGGLLGAGFGFWLARSLSRLLQRPTMRSSELPAADAAGSRSP
jgi:hypothetical protein